MNINDDTIEQICLTPLPELKKMVSDLIKDKDVLNLRIGQEINTDGLVNIRLIARYANEINTINTSLTKLTTVIWIMETQQS